MKNHFDITISAQTVRNILQEEGLKACVKVKKLHMSKTNMRNRLEFAIQYEHRSVKDWNQGSFLMRPRLAGLDLMEESGDARKRLQDSQLKVNQEYRASWWWKHHGLGLHVLVWCWRFLEY